jgi:hypothetical protein
MGEKERNYMWRSYPIVGLQPGMHVLVGLAVIWSLVWKGLALWKAARNGSKPWFVVLLIVNTLGILEILYIYVFSKKAPPVQGAADVTVKPE